MWIYLGLDPVSPYLKADCEYRSPVKLCLPANDYETGIIQGTYDLINHGQFSEKEDLIDLEKTFEENDIQSEDRLLAVYKPCKVTNEEKRFTEVAGQIVSGVCQNTTFEYTTNKKIQTVVKTVLSYKNGALISQKINTDITETGLSVGHYGEIIGSSKEMTITN